MTPENPYGPPPDGAVPGDANDHHSGWTSEQVSEALLTAIRAWGEAGCDCCSPNPLEDALDGLREHGDALRRFGIAVAFVGQSLVEEEGNAR